MLRSLSLATVAVAVLAGCGSSSSPSASAPPKAQNHLHSIAILPGHPSEAYFGGHYYLYRTNNGGKQWTRLTKQMMLSLALNGRTPSTIYAVSLQKGLVVSHDAGKHWSAPPSAIPKGNITGVVLDAATGAIFAYGAGIYRSTDAGAHWTRSNATTSVYNVAFGTGSTVYASTGNGLLVSTDAGRHWKTQKTIGAQPVVQVAAAGPTAYAITAIGLMKTTNNGATWTTLDRAPAGIEFMGVAPSDPRQVVAEVSQKGFFETTDGGATWKASTGIHDRKFTGSTVQVASGAPNVAYTGAWGLHVYTTHDGGRHWTQTATLKD